MAHVVHRQHHHRHPNTKLQPITLTSSVLNGTWYATILGCARSSLVEGKWSGLLDGLPREIAAQLYPSNVNIFINITNVNINNTNNTPFEESHSQALRKQAFKCVSRVVGLVNGLPAGKVCGSPPRESRRGSSKHKEKAEKKEKKKQKTKKINKKKKK